IAFSRSTSLLQSLSPGDVLVDGAPNAIAPHGFMRKVSSIQSNGGGVVLATTQANLMDVATRLSIDHTQSLQSTDVATATPAFDGVGAPEPNTAGGAGYGPGYD